MSTKRKLKRQKKKDAENTLGKDSEKEMCWKRQRIRKTPEKITIKKYIKIQRKRNALISYLYVFNLCDSLFSTLRYSVVGDATVPM